MNLNNHCPVQASIDSYCAQFDESEALDNAIEREKSQLWDALSAETIAEILCEVPDKDAFYVDIRNLITEINQTNRCDIERAVDIGRSLWRFVDEGLEQEAVRRVNERLDEDERYQVWCEEQKHDH